MMNLKAQKNPFQIPHAEQYLRVLLPRLEEKRVQSFTTIILALATLSFFGIFAISPTLATIADLQKQISDNQFVNMQLQQKIANLTNLEGQYKDLQKDLPILYTAIPPEPNVTTLVGQIQTIAQKSQVNLLQVQTLPVDVTGVVSTQFNSFAFALDISGSYANIQSFLKSLTSYNRIVTIDAVSLTKSLTDTTTYNLSVRGRTYFKSQ